MRYIVQASAKCHPGREDDYDKWYEETHMRDVLGVDGFLSCERYRAIDLQSGDAAEFVAEYEVETDNPGALLQSLYEASARMVISDALDPATAKFIVLQPDGRGRRS